MSRRLSISPVSVPQIPTTSTTLPIHGNESIYQKRRRELPEATRIYLSKFRLTQNRRSRQSASGVKTGQSHSYLFGGEGEIGTRARVVPLPVSPALYPRLPRVGLG